jgi:hypothetical protein
VINYKKERILLLALAFLFLSGLVFSKSTYAAGPLVTVKNSIQAKLDGGVSVAEAVCHESTDDECTDEATGEVKTECCTNTTTAAIEMELDTQDVVASAIDCGCDPVAVGNAAYNAGANLHDIYMAGGLVYSMLRMMLNSLPTGLRHHSFRETTLIVDKDPQPRQTRME